MQVKTNREQLENLAELEKERLNDLINGTENYKESNRLQQENWNYYEALVVIIEDMKNREKELENASKNI